MVSRRDALKAMTTAVAAVALPAVAVAKATDVVPTLLWMERAGSAYLVDLQFTEGRAAANWLLRDVRGGDVVGSAPPRVLFELAWMQAYLAGYGWHRPFIARSGLRMPWTNANTEGAARNSLHLPKNYRRKDLRFEAVDVSMPDVKASLLAELATHARVGGVLLYEDRDFLHLDTGPVRAYRMPPSAAGKVGRS